MNAWKYLRWVPWAFVMSLVITSLSPSSLFFRPLSVQIEGYNVTVYRNFPAKWLVDPVTVSYVEKVSDLTTGKTCSDDNASGFPYDSDKGGKGNWNIEHWAAPCMQHTFRWYAAWRVRWFGVGMFPVKLEATFNPSIETSG